MKRFKKGSVFTLLLRNFVIFTGVLMVVLTMLFSIYAFRMVIIMSKIEPTQIKTYDDVLSDENYSEFPTEILLGAKSFIAVLDEEARVLYQENEEYQLPPIQKEDISFISNYIESPNIDVHDFADSKSKINKSVSIQLLQDGVSTYQEYILDEKYNIVYASHKIGASKLSPLQFQLLTDTLDPNYYLQKYNFLNKDGRANTLLLFTSKENLSSLVGHNWRSFFTVCTLLYGVLLLIFVRWLNKRIKKPLNLLCEELNDFVSGSGKQASYKGPREFVEIFESFNGMSNRLEESEKARVELEVAKQKMLADISHDLKTPITVVQGYAKALADNVVPVDERQQYLEIIVQKATGLNELINTFYEYNKMEYPDYSLTLELIDIFNFIRDYVAEQYDAWEVAGLKVEVDIPETHVKCYIDQVQLKRVFENIVGNAIKHNPKGTILFLGIKKEIESVKIVIADNGAGIPEEIAVSIFEAFVVGEKSRGKQGSGLGLAIAKKIVDAHKGSIQLLRENEPYKTTFEIILPIAHMNLNI